MKFRCAGITDSISDGIGISLMIFFQGCTLHCPGCHNPELQPLDGGYEYDTGMVEGQLVEHVKFYESVVYTGGEPSEQWPPVIEIAEHAHSLGKYNILYTGLTYDQVPLKVKEVMDIVVDGPFKEELKVAGRFPASTNQGVNGKPEVVNLFMRNKPKGY